MAPGALSLFVRNLSSAGILFTIGVRSGPIGGHGTSPHHEGLPVKYKLSGIVRSGIAASQITALLT